MKLLTKKIKLLDCYQSLIESKEGLISEDDIELQSTRKKDFEGEQFRVVVAGRFSSGKSSLINAAFLQDNVLPAKINPTTRHPVYIQYGEKKQLVLREAGHTEFIAGDTETIRSALINYGTSYGTEADRDRYQMIELNWPDTDLLKSGIVIVDTIGTEDTEEKYIQQTYKEMERASAVLFLTSVQQAGTNTEKELLEKYLSNTGKKLFIVLTQSDTIDAEQHEEVQLDFCQRFKVFFYDNNIRAVDRICLTSSKTGDGISELRQNLIDFIAKDSFNELFQQHTQQLESFLQRIKKESGVWLSDYKSKKAGDELLLRKTLEEISNLEKILLNNESEMHDIKVDLKEDAKYSLDVGYEKLREKTLGALRNASADDLKIIVQDIVFNFEILSKNIGQHVQSNIRKVTEKRIREYGSGIDSDSLYERISFIEDSTSIDWTKRLGSLGEISGLGAIFMSVYMGISAAGSTATTGAVATAQTGAIKAGIAWLFGTTPGSTAAISAGAGVTTSVTAGLLAAAPWLFGGVAAIWAGKEVSTHLVAHLEKKNKEETIKTVKTIFFQFYTEFQKTIENYIDIEVDNMVSKASKEIEKQQKHLQSVINENDTNQLQKHIDYELSKIKNLDELINQVKACQLA